MIKLTRSITKASKQYFTLIKLVEDTKDIERKKRTTCLIQLGGILDISGMLNSFGIFKGDEIDSKKEAIIIRFVLNNILPLIKHNPYEYEILGKSYFLKLGIVSNDNNQESFVNQQRLQNIGKEKKDASKKQKLRTLIQAGAIVSNTGLLQLFGVNVTDDLQNQHYPTACAIMGAICFTLENIKSA